MTRRLFSPERIKSSSWHIASICQLGKFRDETGDLLTPTHTKRHGRRLRYYISNRLISGGTDISGWRLPAPGFERAIANAVADHLTILAKRHKLLHNISARETKNTSKDALELTTALRSMNQQLLSEIVIYGQIAKDRIQIKLNGDLLSDRLGHPTSDLNPELLDWVAPFSCRRRGVELKIIAGDPVSTPDQALIQCHAQSP